MAKMIMEDHAGLVGKSINHEPAHILIKALFAAEKNATAENAKKIYDEIFINGKDNKSALARLGLHQKPLDIYIAGMQSDKLILLPLSLVLSHILPA